MLLSMLLGALAYSLVIWKYPSVQDRADSLFDNTLKKIKSFVPKKGG